MNTLPLWLILTPLALALIAALGDRAGPRFRRALAVCGACAVAALTLTVVWAVRRHGALHTMLGGWAAPWGIGLRVDDFNAIFILILGVGLAAGMVFLAGARAFVKGEAPLIFLLAAAGNGILAAADLFNLFVFVELASVCSAALIALKRQRDNTAAGFQYLVYGALSGMIFLVAVLLIYGATGHLSMAHIAAHIHRMPPRLYGAALAGIIVAFGVKIGLIPLHFWQARAYAAAGSSMAALMSGVMMKIYLCALLRVLWHPLAIRQHSAALTGTLLALGAINVLGGHLMALAQRDLKRLLAFSSVAHVGYILMGIGAGSELGLVAGLYHVVNHVLMKTALFWSGRAFILHAGSADERRFRGVASAAPLAFAIFFVAALTIVGAPPTGGFASKWLIALAVYARHGLWPVVVIALGTLISLTYYGRVFRYALIPSADNAPTANRSVNIGERWPPILAACGCLATGLGIRWLLPWLERAAAALAAG